MSDAVIRGSWLTGGVKYLGMRHSPETTERLLSGLSRSLRGMLAEIQPVEWYARAHHVELMKAIVSSYRDDAGALESLLGYGQMVAADLAGGRLRPLIQIVTPKLLAKRLPQLWVSDHQEDGVLEVDIAAVDEGRLSLRLTELSGYEHVGMATLGWVKGLLVALGCRDVAVKPLGWSLREPAPNETTAEVRWS